MPLPLTSGPAPLLLVAEHDTPARQFLADNFVADGYDAIPAADYDGAVRALTGDRQLAAMVVDLARDTLRLIDAVRRDDHRLDAGLPILAFAAGPEALHRVRARRRGRDAQAV
jgi:DNA-binding response OmpR family regulator